MQQLLHLIIAALSPLSYRELYYVTPRLAGHSITLQLMDGATVSFYYVYYELILLSPWPFLSLALFLSLFVLFRLLSVLTDIEYLAQAGLVGCFSCSGYSGPF